MVLASLLHPFKKCCGVELLTSLHQYALEIKRRFVLCERLEQQICEIVFVQADVCELDYTFLADADLIFSACTMFSAEMLAIIAVKKWQFCKKY